MSDPGLVVVDDVAAADDATALAFQQLLADRWATATAERTTRDLGRARCSAALPPGPAPGAHRCRRGRPDQGTDDGPAVTHDNALFSPNSGTSASCPRSTPSDEARAVYMSWVRLPGRSVEPGCSGRRFAASTASRRTRPRDTEDGTRIRRHHRYRRFGHLGGTERE
ncbi:DUF6207 family protein [Streptomyces sp. NPDC088812]|uniref:DUF6207 family protein n=1 Tax=Streptomyces sp. NPDC088812 TaxID=3365905 RepID=UPI00382009F3